jgi:Protein of unknown function (DUF2380)
MTHGGTLEIAYRTFVWPRLIAALLLCAASLAGVSASAAGPEPIKLAIFDFELDDFSAGASSAGEAPADTKYLADVTSEVRRLFAQSGRYRLVDVGGADAEPVRNHTLHTCDGCEAAIARQLGAEQSLVGVVKRISRTEYQVRLQIRDAGTGAIIADEDSGLRMGADYSWSRGARRLVQDRLLATSDQQ